MTVPSIRMTRLAARIGFRPICWFQGKRKSKKLRKIIWLWEHVSKDFAAKPFAFPKTRKSMPLWLVLLLTSCSLAEILMRQLCCDTTEPWQDGHHSGDQAEYLCRRQDGVAVPAVFHGVDHCGNDGVKGISCHWGVDSDLSGWVGCVTAIMCIALRW